MPRAKTPPPVDPAIRIQRLWDVVLGINGDKGLTEKVDEMNQRIHKLEISQAKVMALAVVLGGLVSGIIVSLGSKLLGG